ncbi:unnamed protein product [Parnassius apollo]|uniref:(apollo) hypothetical protein n=1 Tax=Parnassius apollo TaxID=110799 RepID=A0A8S3WTK0_PARAO|nr:unnamed protein product [Parnassius apollo]
MYSGKNAVNPAYPTQWALNPTAYQNIDSSQVDWAALAQQWIAMKEAAAIVAAPQPPAKPDIEGGEAPMEVENPDTNCESIVPPGAEWNAATNSWGNTWNQWGWGWQGNDPKMAGDPSMTMTPMMDGYPVAPDNASAMPGYTTTGAVATPTFQHGYWTAPQVEQSNSRSSSRNQDNRSKSKNRDSKSSRNRSHREKVPVIPPVMDHIDMPAMGGTTATIDAAKRRQLPAWIREGLEKMEREKQRAMEREQEKKAREEAEKEKKRLEEEELERMKAEASGQPMLPAKSKFDSDSDNEDVDKEEPPLPEPEQNIQEENEPEEIPAVKTEPDEKPTLVQKSKEEIMQEVMYAVRRSLTEILLEVTDQEIHTVSQEELARYNAAQASRLNAMKASKSKALAAIASGLGLGAYESSSDGSGDEDDQKDLSDHQLQEIIKRKRLEFERTAREIEAEVRRAELRENAEEPTTPVATPERPRRSRSSATPPPIETETPEKKPERRMSKDVKKNNHKSSDKQDGVRRLGTIPEEKVKKTNKWEKTPSPQIKSTSEKDSSSSSSSDSDDSSSSSSDSSSESDQDAKVVRSKKRKRRSSSENDPANKSKKENQKKIQKTDERNAKSKHGNYEKYEKSRTKKNDEHYDKHKSSRNERHKDKYRDDSDDDRPRKRSKRSTSYESRSGRKRTSRDRSEERSRRRDKRSYDRDSSKRDRSYDRSGRDYERSGRDYDRSGRDYERSGRDYERSGRDHDKYDRYLHERKDNVKNIFLISYRTSSCDILLLFSVTETAVQTVEDDENDPICGKENEVEKDRSLFGNLSNVPSVKTSTPTRWPSVLEMLENMAHCCNRNPINNILRRIGQDDLKIVQMEWNLLEDLIKFFGKFREVVEGISSQKRCTINFGLVLKTELKEVLNSIADHETLIMLALKNNRLANLVKRFPTTETLVTAALLDCRFIRLKEIDTYLEAKAKTPASFVVERATNKIHCSRLK